MVVRSRDVIFIGKLGRKSSKTRIINNLKIEGNTPYLILLFKDWSLTYGKSMIRYLLYMYILANKKKERLAITTSNSESHSKLMRGWTRDASFQALLLGVVKEDAPF